MVEREKNTYGKVSVIVTVPSHFLVEGCYLTLHFTLIQIISL